MLKSNLLDKYKPEEILDLYHKNNNNFVKTAKQLNVYFRILQDYFIKNNLEYDKDIHKFCDDYLFSRDNERSFYWAGFLAADGCINSKKPQISLKLSNKDIGHLEKFKKDLGSNATIFTEPVFKDEKIIRYYSVIKIHSKQMVSDLQRFNIVPRKSLIYKFPESVLYNENIKHFIRGIIDGDGWVYQWNNSSDIGFCGTKHCVETIALHLEKVLNLSKLTIHPQGKIYKFLSRRLEDNIKIYHYLYDEATIWLDRKYETAIKISNIIPNKKSITKKEIITIYEKHKNSKDVAENLNVSISVLNRRILEFNIRKEIDQIILPSKTIIWRSLSKEQIKEEFKKIGLKNMIEKYKVSEATIYRAIR